MPAIGGKMGNTAAGMDAPLLRHIYVLLALLAVAVALDRSPHAKAAPMRSGAGAGVTNVTRMHADLRRVPAGSAAVVHLNLAYNHIRKLDNYTFAENRYRDVRTLYLFRNAIASVSADAFRGLPQLATVDLSDNNLTTLAYDTFAHSHHLRELVLVNNCVRFERQATFLRSHSLQTLSLAGNRITDVYDATFVGLANLRRLMLADNPLASLSPMCFKSLRKLRYLSLVNTDVHRIHVDMFFAFPRLIRVGGTPFAETFRPPLTQLTSESFAELTQFDQTID